MGEENKCTFGKLRWKERIAYGTGDVAWELLVLEDRPFLAQHHCL